MKNKMVFQRAMLFTALGILCVMLLMCIWPSLFTKYGTKDIFAAWQSPSKKHILGTNDMGYDIFTELVYAAFSTLFTGIASASAAVAAGTIVGLLCGYANGWLKELLKLLTNIFLPSWGLLRRMIPRCWRCASFTIPRASTMAEPSVRRW